MTFKCTNVNVISIIPRNIDIPIYRKFQYRVIGIYKKTIIIDIPQHLVKRCQYLFFRGKNEDEEKIKEKKLNKKKQAKQKIKEDLEDDDEGAGWEEVKSSHSTVREKLFKLTLFILDIPVLNCSS
jgi:hypothetical protein